MGAIGIEMQASAAVTPASGTCLAAMNVMPGQSPSRTPIDPEDRKLDERGRPSGPKDAGREADPIPSKAHREHDPSDPDDEIEEPKLGGPDLAELAEDPLKNAEGPDA